MPRAFRPHGVGGQRYDQRVEGRKAAKAIAKASIEGTGWKDEGGNNADKMILELAGAHVSYNPNQQ